MTSFELINPASEEPIRSIKAIETKEFEAQIERSSIAFKNWRKLSFEQRAEFFRGIAILLRRNSEVIAQQITQEMGKILSEAKSEIEKCAACCLYYADNGEQLLNSRQIPTEFKKSYVSYEPLGTVFAILPWNFPYWQFFRFAVPTMMAGNTILFKHAPSTMGCAETIVTLFKQAGFPENVMSHIPVTVEQVELIIADRRIHGVSLTGSTRAGRSVATLAGKYLKPCVLELGGSDAYVILDDADLNFVADKLILARFLNCGQSCISGKRFIATKKTASALEGFLLERIRNITIGSPIDAKVKMGPMARKDLRDLLHQQVERAKQQGLRVAVGGNVPSSMRGFFYPATLLVGATPKTVAFDEELFGPVATLAIANDEAQALEWANASDYGLGSAIFSSDRDRAEALAREHLESGLVFVNDYVRSDIRMPFGGIKQSGLGRELSQDGIRSFTNAKAIYVNDSLRSMSSGPKK